MQSIIQGSRGGKGEWKDRVRKDQKEGDNRERQRQPIKSKENDDAIVCILKWLRAVSHHALLR